MARIRPLYDRLIVKEVVIVGHPGVLGVELLGVLDVFELVNLWLADQGRPPGVRTHVTTVGGGQVRLSGGVELSCSSSLLDHRHSIDTLVIPGGHCALAASEDRELVVAVSQAASRAGRVVGLCTGAFILAAAGLLDGRRATTHWNHGECLAKSYPAVVVDTDPIFSRAGNIWTSAGVMASFDLLLALVEEDFGSEAARSVARSLVLFLRRSGNQAQFSAQLLTQLADRHPIRELQQFIADHPEANLSLEALAERVHMSVRHFTRIFRSETGLPPGRYVERVRLETARRRLEEADLSVDAVAAAVGFGSSETLRRVFVQTLGVSPTEYRRRFGVPAGDATVEVSS